MSDWRHRAACRPGNLDAGDLGAEIFFPVGSTGPSLQWIEDAKAICRRCPDDVTRECLDYALDHNSDGVWGATSEDERRSIKRRDSRNRYSAQAQAEAVRLYGEVRGLYASDWAACRAVAERCGITRIKTVKAWVDETPALHDTINNPEG